MEATIRLAGSQRVVGELGWRGVVAIPSITAMIRSSPRSGGRTAPTSAALRSRSLEPAGIAVVSPERRSDRACLVPRVLGGDFRRAPCTSRIARGKLGHVHQQGDVASRQGPRGHHVTVDEKSRRQGSCVRAVSSSLSHRPKVSRFSYRQDRFNRHFFQVLAAWQT